MAQWVQWHERLTRNQEERSRKPGDDPRHRVHEMLEPLVRLQQAKEQQQLSVRCNPEVPAMPSAFVDGWNGKLQGAVCDHVHAILDWCYARQLVALLHRVHDHRVDGVEQYAVPIARTRTFGTRERIVHGIDHAPPSALHGAHETNVEQRDRCPLQVENTWRSVAEGAPRASETRRIRQPLDGLTDRWAPPDERAPNDP